MNPLLLIIQADYVSKNAELRADFGPMELDLDNLNAMLSGSGGKSPDLSFPINRLSIDTN